MINIVVPMAGQGSRFAKAGFTKPKPFIEFLGKPMIAHVLDNLYFEGAKYTLIARKEHCEANQEIVAWLLNNYDVEFVYIDKLTEGTACTVLHAHRNINNDSPLVIANSDQLIDVKFNKFVKDAFSRKLNGSILCFKEPSLDPKWSYAKVDENGFVALVKEKEAISDMATVGIYYYSSGKNFVDSAIDMIVNNDRVNQEFYTCPSYNYMIQNGLSIGVFEIPKNSMHGIGTPEDLKNYLRKFNES